jgi:hypothetical protein
MDYCKGYQNFRPQPSNDRENSELTCGEGMCLLERLVGEIVWEGRDVVECQSPTTPPLADMGFRQPSFDR